MIGEQDTPTAQACALVISQINHTRHAPKKHFLARAGLSILIDLDRLEEANTQSYLFSVGRFNLLSFHETDYGCFHKLGTKARPHASLSAYIKDLAKSYGITGPFSRLELLTFPRILGVSFNPLSVYRCLDETGGLRFVVYEVHNTFGEAHSYVGIGDDKGRVSLHESAKVFHVSPFFDVTGDYQLLHRQQEQDYRLIIRYRINKALALTATLRGTVTQLSARSIITNLLKTRQWPMRPLLSIHIEALKLALKRLRFFSKPLPPKSSHSFSSTKES